MSLHTRCIDTRISSTGVLRIIKKYGVVNLENIQSNNGPGSRHMFIIASLHPMQIVSKSWILPLNHIAATEKPQDAGCRVERAEQQGDAAILAEMADRLAAGPCGINIGGFVRTEDCKGSVWEAFGGEVDMVAGEGGRGHEEEALLEGPVSEGGGDGRVELGHYEVYRARL